MKTTLWILLLTFPLGLYSQIGSKIKSGTDSGIAGIWENNDFGFTMTLMLNKDGSGEFDGESITYTVAGNQISLVYPEGTTTYQYSMSGAKMTLSGGDLDGPIVFVRLDEEKNANPAYLLPEPGNSVPANDKIVGKWEGNGETMDFRTDGTVIIQGYSIPYSLTSSQLTLQGTTGNQTFPYSIQGDILSININGQNQVYKKSGSTAGQSGTGSQLSGDQSSGGSIARELVGKWCYMNVSSGSTGGWSTDECITINADGTYEYYYESSGSATGYNQYGDQTFYGGTASQDSDRGTWRLSGNTLLVQSQSRGAQTYTLQKVNHPKTNDPMIVLDGRAYVTYYQKAPW